MAYVQLECVEEKKDREEQGIFKHDTTNNNKGSAICKILSKNKYLKCLWSRKDFLLKFSEARLLV